jgi:hypothetical protein
VSCIERHKGIRPTDGLCLYPDYSASDAYASINDIHVTRLNAINCDSNINHLYTLNIIHSVHFISIFMVRQMYNFLDV